MTKITRDLAQAIVRAAVLLAACVDAAGVAEAARVRPFVEVVGPVVRLSDLFSGLEPGQDVQLGEAPAPGGQIVIRAAQLVAIADQFGVSWDGPRDGVATTLLRPGHKLDSASVLAKIRPALTSAGVDPKSVVSIDHLAGLRVDDSSVITVEPPELDASRRHFRTVLHARCGNDEILATELTGSIEAAIGVVVPTRAIKPGEILTSDDITLASMAENKVPADAMLRTEDAVGQEVRSPLFADAPIGMSMLRRADLVRKGGPVAMHLAESGIDIAAQGVALQSGALDDRVSVLNPSSHAVLFGWVIGDSEVRIDADTRPNVPTSSFATFGPAYR